MGCVVIAIRIPWPARQCIVICFSHHNCACEAVKVTDLVSARVRCELSLRRASVFCIGVAIARA